MDLTGEQCEEGENRGRYFGTNASDTAAKHRKPGKVVGHKDFFEIYSDNRKKPSTYLPVPFISHSLSRFAADYKPISTTLS